MSPLQNTKTFVAILIGLAAGVLSTGCATEVGDDLIDNDDYAGSEEDNADPFESVADEEVDSIDDVAGDSITTIAAQGSWMDSAELDFVAKINAYRKKLGRKPLRVSIGLTKAAEIQALSNGAYDRNSPVSSTKLATYYPYSTAVTAQNLTKLLPGTEVSPFSKFLAQGGATKANMEDSRFTVMGIARKYYSENSYYWVVVFGSYQDPILSAGTTSIGSNGSFESNPKVDPTTGKSTWGVPYTSVRKVNRWYLWSRYNDDDLARDSYMSFVGNYALYVSDSYTDYSLSATQMVTAASGVKYKVSGITHDLTSENPQRLYMQFLASDFSTLGTYGATMPTNTRGFQTVSTAEVVAPTGTAYVRYFIYSSAGDTSEQTWDDIRVTAL